MPTDTGQLGITGTAWQWPDRVENPATVLAEAFAQWYQKAMAADIDSLHESGGETWY